VTPDPETAPLDGTDQAILDQLADLYDRLDPPPPDLDERVRFAIALDDLDAEVARLTAEQPVAAARASERTRTMTFDAQSRTIMLTVVDRPDGLVRLDGWLAPPAALRVELRFPEPAAPRVVTADDTGRFVFDQVTHGLAQVLVHGDGTGDGAGPATRVVTPSFAL
jgi:hypothetical protein